MLIVEWRENETAIQLRGILKSKMARISEITRGQTMPVRRLDGRHDVT
jgi:hypothetical protein